MGIAYVDERRTALAVGALLLLSLSLGGCATSSGSSLMGGRADAAVPPTTSVYLPVEDLPPQRENPAMTPDERLKMQKELNAARDRQEAGSKARAHAAPAKPAKPK